MLPRHSKIERIRDCITRNSRSASIQTLPERNQGLDTQMTRISAAPPRTQDGWTRKRKQYRLSASSHRSTSNRGRYHTQVENQVVKPKLISRFPLSPRSQSRPFIEIPRICALKRYTTRLLYIWSLGRVSPGIFFSLTLLQ